MLKSSGAMAAATLTSRVLGMVREMVYAAFMGNTAVASAFTLAFQVPNLFRRLLGEGALTAAFIPIFKQKELHAGEQEMWRTANVVISGVFIATAAVTVLAIIGIILLVLSVGLTQRAHAIGCDVNELINAFNDATVTHGDDTIDLAAGCTYTLTAVQWDAVERVAVRGLDDLPEGMFD